MNLLRVLLFVLIPLTAMAADDPFIGLAGGYDDVRRAVDALAVSGSAQAEPTIAALQEGRLFVAADKSLWIRRGDAMLNARTGVAGTPEAPLRRVRVNNAGRRAIEAAMGTLTLFSADPVKRLSAAVALLDQPDPAALPMLGRALAQERNPTVRQAIAQARAAALLADGKAPVPELLAAVAILRDRGDLKASNLLAAAGNWPPEVATAAARAVAAIAREQRLWALAQGAFYGVSLGSVLLLAAAGLAITFGVMGVINMAHGEMVMLGAYTTFIVQQAIAAYAPALSGTGILMAVPLAFLVSGAAGIAIERLLIRFLYGRPLETLLATWGLSLGLQQAVRSVFGASNRDVTTPEWMSGAIQWGGLTVTYNRLYIMLFATLVLAALAAVLRATPFGLRMRAVTQNRRMAAAMGIRTPWIDALTFGLGSGVAGMAGVALSQIDNVSPNLGQGYIIDSFMVVVFGGVGNLWGTVVSALTLGIVNKFLEPVAGAVLGKILILVLLILFIQRKPRGLFPLKGRAAEA
jgi:urea transport system permease protein